MIERPDEQHVDDHTRSLFAEIEAEFGMVPNFFREQATADPAWLALNWRRWQHIMGQQRALDRKTKELLAVAVSLVKRCDYCTMAHEMSARMAGCSDQEITEMKEVVELFASFTQIADALQIPCDVKPARLQSSAS
mgnify:CR=1 FL=1